MTLSFKSMIYQQTGIYLAHREELAYVKSKEFWQQFAKIYKRADYDMLPRDIQGLLIGLWQAENGFYREYKRGRRR